MREPWRLKALVLRAVLLARRRFELKASTRWEYRAISAAKCNDGRGVNGAAA